MGESGPGEIRTRDLGLAKRLLYPLSYRPTSTGYQYELGPSVLWKTFCPLPQRAADAGGS
jgi:hypothetical protein